MRLPTALALLVALLANSNDASGDVIYGDIAGGNQIFSGYYVGPGGGLNNSIAQGFTMTQSYDLQSVDIILANFTPQAGSNIALSIYSNNGSNNPGTDLYDLSTNVTLASSGTPTQLNYTGSGSFLLNAGTKYWLLLYATNPASATGSYVEWHGEYNSGLTAFAVPTGIGATELGQLRSVAAGNPPVGVPSTTELRTAFQLNGTLVPEPSSLLLAGFGALGLFACRRRHGRLARVRLARNRIPDNC